MLSGTRSSERSTLIAAKMTQRELQIEGILGHVLSCSKACFRAALTIVSIALRASCMAMARAYIVELSVSAYMRGVHPASAFGRPMVWSMLADHAT